MGRKKRGVNVLKPFCYYCDKEFENVNILLQHQKNRHFACKLCTRKFSTAASLCTHMMQVHGTTIQKVPNAIAGRDKVDINIYGMDEVPSEIIEERLAKKINKKKIKLEQELKKKYGIDLDDPKFDLADYEIPDIRPRKRQKTENQMVYGHFHPAGAPAVGPPPGLGMPGQFMPPPPGMFPPPPMGLPMPPPGMHPQNFRMPVPPQPGRPPVQIPERSSAPTSAADTPGQQ